ncbi:feruloyl-CoA synthase [Halomonas sp. MCCC 1A17488]|nr:feruloyl-CoA synthase [Halomonas sp. MCCC 1A17488]MCE8018405.1 feruloyl-CoA synthase [Halomonas sp. MCCC 1A17488]MCG3241738.1 feruloyl-CoA synthase [Halomonas sp. MCCC 1A17488]QPP49235.1 feruloyl-CoA synthase [Halomonas sp. SS10-MC5]
MSSSFRDVRLGTATAKLILRDDGTRLLTVEEPLGDYPDTLLECLERWADETPERTFVARRDGAGEWQRLSYAETLARVRRLAQGLLNHGLSVERPLAILSGNSIEHLLLSLAAMYVGIPFAPVSPAYSLVSRDYGKLRHIVELLTPGLLMVDKAEDFAPALAAVQPADCGCVAVEAEGFPMGTFDELLDTPVTAAVEEARAAVVPDTIVKFLFTSGSTGMPKGVINTHRMLCANQEMLASLMPFMRDEPPVLVDWLPWNHTFGGNHNVGIVLYNGGSLYIDDGRPVPGEFEKTIANLREIAPTVYFNVPKGFEILVDYLKREDALRETFFSRLNLMFFAAAGLSQHIWDELDRLAIQTLGCKVGMLTGLGATETAPSAMFASLEESRSGVVGLPARGVTIKLVPNGGKLECRVKGPSVMPGYWRQPEVTARSFDEEGFYCLGDAVKFIDPDDPQRGMRFDGRISEDFKLDTGTWVSVGPLRARIIEAGAPYVKDVVIAGLDRPYVAVMVFPDLEKCRELAGLGSEIDAATVLASEPVHERFLQMLRDLDAHSTGSSTRVRRLVLLDEPPRLDAHEITDKGSINQRAVLENRAAIVEALYREPPPPSVLRLD